MGVRHPPLIRCPTCGVSQDWTSTCRRCRCDLKLLQAAQAAYEQNRRECLRMLYGGFCAQALVHARRCQALRPGAEALRLVALCHLIDERFDAALETARSIDPGPSVG